MADLKKAIENFDKYLESEEGKASTEAWFKKLEFKKNLKNKHIETLHRLYKNNLDAIIEKVITKYESKEYRDKEYKLGREPDEVLYTLFLDYAEVYSKPCREFQYMNDFTGDIYYLGSYVIQIMHGQGSFIRLEKQKNPPIIIKNKKIELSEVEDLYYQMAEDWHLWDEQEQGPYPIDRIFDVMKKFITCQEQKKI